VRHLLRETPFFKVKLGALSFAGIEPRLHLGGRAGEDDECIDSPDRRSDASGISYVTDEHVVTTSDFASALFTPE
jgi:hypothetical protein